MSKQSESSIYQLNDYRPYIRKWGETQGRGEYRKISSALGIHTTLLSQIMSQRKCLTQEQCARLCVYMKLNPTETEFFLTLVQLERAGNEELRDIFRRRLDEIRKNVKEVKSHLPKSLEMTDQDRAVFYSSWLYSAVRLLTDIKSYQTPESISRRLAIPLSRTHEILDFLVSRGLCDKKGSRYKRTSTNTHVSPNSALAIRHHQNWRAKSVELIEQSSVEDLSFTAPVSISQEDIPKVREMLLANIAEITKKISASKASEVVYFGVDWVKI